MMLSVQYIIGHGSTLLLNLIIGFIQQTQDARISLERLAEIHTKKDEDDPSTTAYYRDTKGERHQNHRFVI